MINKYSVIILVNGIVENVEDVKVDDLTFEGAAIKSVKDWEASLATSESLTDSNNLDDRIYAVVALQENKHYTPEVYAISSKIPEREYTARFVKAPHELRSQEQEETA